MGKEERKARRAQRQAERESRRFNESLDRPAELAPMYYSNHSKNGRVLDAASVFAVGQGGPSPIVGKAEVMNPVDKPKIKYSMGQPPASNDGDIPEVAPIVGKAEVTNPLGIAKNSKGASKPKTLSDLLAEQRKAAIKEKTDAVKMQKYYALTDAFNALGKMGGAAVGGAIGGNMLDSAPAVADYQPSRGYVNAFEQAKKANDRLRALDEKGFQLALRDEERSYKQQQDKLNKEWQKQMIDYRNEINRANAAEDFERSKKLKEEMAEKERKYQKELLALKNRYAVSDDARKKEYLQKQYDLYNPKIPIPFDDGSGVEVSKTDYDGMFRYMQGKTIGGQVVSKDNFDIVLRENPQLVNDYLKMFGRDTSISHSATVTQEPLGGTKEMRAVSPAGDFAPSVNTYSQWRSEHPKNLVEAEPEPIGFDIFAYERK